MKMANELARTHEAASAHPLVRPGYVAFMLPLLGYAMFLGESWFGNSNPTWALALVVWALGAGVAAWWLTRETAHPFLGWVERYATSIVVTLTAGVAVAFVTASVLQSRYFAVGPHAEDTAYYSQVLWNTLQGSFLAGNVQQERLYNPPVSSDLALHVSPVLLVVLLPVYALFPHAVTLLVVRDLALTAATWPLFLMARERIGATAGVAAAVLYLANPAVVSQGLEAFYLLHLTPLPFFFAFRAFLRRHLAGFLGWVGVAIAMREDVAIALVGFGLWALWQRRPLRWSVLAFGVPLAWWALATLVIQPAFGRWGNSALDAGLSGGRGTPLGVYHELLGNLFWLVEAIRDGGLEYLYRVLRPVAFLGIAGAEGLVALPGLLATLFLSRAFSMGIDPVSRFALLPSCALMAAAVVVAARLQTRVSWNARASSLILLLLLPSTSLVDGVKDVVRARWEAEDPRNDAAALREAIARIPGDASVAAPSYALPDLAHRPRLFYLQYLDRYPDPRVDYILFDLNLERVTTNPKVQETYLRLKDSLWSAGKYEAVWTQGEYVLFKRRAKAA